jgi:hypothetical protein
MKTLFLSIALILTVQFLSAQTEISLYVGILDYPGLSFEQYISDKISIEIGGSYRYRQGDILFADAPNNDISTNALATLGIKKYQTGDNGKDNFFYGGYLRYWQTHWSVKNLDNLTLSQQQYADSVALTTSNTSHKISIGALVGYKFYFGNHFTLAITGGLGFSPKQTYWREIEEYNRPTRTYLQGGEEIIGDWNHLSGIGRLSLGYKF